MPWYRDRTVSVVQNSSTVTGTNTSFIQNSMVGDAFLGPDGRWYEVTNIASDTALSIAPNYLGPTSGAGAYALVPIQGYNRDSANVMRSIVKQWGDKLAALGSTANYEILPLIRGGTGGENQEDARISLGLVPQTGQADKTAGSLLTVGAFGRNGTYGIQLDNTGNANSLPAQGRYTFASGGVNLPESTCSIEHNPHAAPGYASQWAEGLTTNNLYHRTQVNGTWGSWDVVAKGVISLAQGGTGNSNGMAQRIVAAAMLGAVSQSGGVPNGAIVETATNANGTYTKLLDGTLICQGPMADFAVGANAIATVSSPATFPALFINSNYFFDVKGTPNASNDVYGFMGHNSKTTSGATAIYRNGATAQSITNCRYLAVGRWFT